MPSCHSPFSHNTKRWIVRLRGSRLGFSWLIGFYSHVTRTNYVGAVLAHFTYWKCLEMMHPPTYCIELCSRYFLISDVFPHMNGESKDRGCFVSYPKGHIIDTITLTISSPAIGYELVLFIDISSLVEVMTKVKRKSIRSNGFKLDSPHQCSMYTRLSLCSLALLFQWPFTIVFFRLKKKQVILWYLKSHLLS